MQALGGQLSASTDADRLALGGSVLTSGLPGLLALLGEVLTGASYPKREVEGERDRLVQELAIYRTQPSVLAREALLRRMYGDHPYGRDLPTGRGRRSRSRPAQLRALHAKRVAPAGSVLVVGRRPDPRPDARPRRGGAARLDRRGRRGRRPRRCRRPSPGPAAARRPARVGADDAALRRPGARAAPTPTHAAFTLANLVFGGYFSSRWVANIREDKGYTYSPNSPSSTRPPARGSWSRPTSPPRSPRPRCSRRCTSSAASRPCRCRRPSSTRPAATRSARSR